MQSPSAEPIAATELRTTLDALRSSISKVIRGKDEAIDQVLVCLSAGGHILLEDLPGLGKTTLAYSLARSIDCDFSRVQFTSDLLPSDVIGVSVYDDRTKAFVFKKGPVFSNIVLADEINRSTPKTQSALLEVMDRGKVSIDGKTYDVPPPFMVFATQNPVDFEGTFPLPESQMDRFMMRLQMGYPDVAFEREILARDAVYGSYDTLQLEPVVTAGALQAVLSATPRVYLEDSVLDYLLALITATRCEVAFASGISTRGGLALKAASQAHALLQGRNFVIPIDVEAVYLSVLTHRLTLDRHVPDPLEERNQVQVVLKRIFGSLRQPS
jgi:MoxR-like ATPase